MGGACSKTSIDGASGGTIIITRDDEHDDDDDVVDEGADVRREEEAEATRRVVKQVSFGDETVAVAVAAPVAVVVDDNNDDHGDASEDVKMPIKSALRSTSALTPPPMMVEDEDEDEDEERVDPAVLRALRDTLAATLPSMGHAKPVMTSTMSAYRAASRTYEGERVDRERVQSGGERPASMRLQSVREEPDVLLLDNRSDEEEEQETPVKEEPKRSIENRVREARREDQRRALEPKEKSNAERTTKTSHVRQEGKKKDSTRWTAPKRTSYERKLDRLFAVAERAGVSAERVNQEISDLNERVENGVIAVQPWEEKGNSWAAERSKSALSERSSSAGTILQPKGLKTARVDGKTLESARHIVEEPKVVTSILRSDLLKAMGEMSAEEKLSRLGLAPVPESSDVYADDVSEHATMGGTPRSIARSQSTPGSRRRAWNERSPATNRDDGDDNYSDGDRFLTPPPAPASSVKSQSQTYVDKLKAQSKLAKLESSRSWKAGVGVVGGQHS